MKMRKNVAMQALSYLDSYQEHKDCLECGEAIFNPICPECILKQFLVWVDSYPNIRKKIINDVKSFSSCFRPFSGKSQTCVVCHRKSGFLCPYCFTEYLLNLLKEKKAGKMILSEFLFIFNYDFEHTGYSKEIEKFGVY